MNNKGFTLIEMLVVVLIIGILAAIALPKYQQAVEKSRAAEAMLFLNSLEKAETIYHHENEEFTSNLSLLPIDVRGNAAAEQAASAYEEPAVAAR